MKGTVLLAALSLDGNVVRPRARARAALLAAAPSGIFAPPARAAALLAAGTVSAIVVLWKPAIVLGPRRRLAAPFLPPDGKRARFRLASARETPEGMLARYRIG